MASRRDDGGRDNTGTNGLQHEPDASFEQTNPANGILGTHDGVGIENVGIEPGKVARIICRCVRRSRDKKGFRRGKCAVHRARVQFIDFRRRRMRLSQESITEKICRLNPVGDTGGNQTLVKSVLAVSRKWASHIHG